MIPFSHIIWVSLLLFSIGVCGVLLRRSLIMMLISVEIMLNAAGLAFVGAAARWGQADGQIFVLFIMAVAASEVAVGLALVVSIHRRQKTVDSDDLKLLKG